MGNSSGKSLAKHQQTYLSKLYVTPSGKLLYRCSIEKWVGGMNALCGFVDEADYGTPREDFRAKSILLRPDLTDGRYLKAEKWGDTKITIKEGRVSKQYDIEIPCSHTSGKIPQKLARLDCRNIVMNYVQQQTSKDGIGVIGCKDNLAVVQFLDRKECYVPEFYFIDLKTETCLGKFHTKDCELLWYECYISPDKTRVLLRPDAHSFSWSVKDTIKVHALASLQIFMMRKFLDSGGHALTFDNRHGNRYVFRAKDKDLQLYDFKTMEVVQGKKGIPLPAPIRQLKSSQSGEFIAARCVYPAFSMEYHTNTIAVIGAQSLELLFQVNAQGPYWPVSELVNLQVFPRFSVCDSAVAVMVNDTVKRRVFVYKLPNIDVSLQSMCRKHIRRNCSPFKIDLLPIPNRLKLYLQFKA